MLLLQEKNFSISRITRGSARGRHILNAIYTLRKEVYRDLGWILSENSAHMVHDAFDDVPSTTHYAIFENERIVGSHRMTRYTSRFRLPFLKDGFDEDLFEVPYLNVSEANRLLIRQDRKYPGCAKQLFYHTSRHQLENYSTMVVSIGDEDHIDFFKYLGYGILEKEVSGVLDEKDSLKVVRKGYPMVASLQTLNPNLGLYDYDIKRDFVVIE